MQPGRIFVMLLLVVLVSAACGDDDDAIGTTASTTTSAPRDFDTTTTVVDRSTTTMLPPETTTTTEPDDDSSIIWFTNSDAGAVGRQDAGNGECIALDLGASADHIAVGLGHVWVADCLSGQLSRIDPETHEVTGRINLVASPVSASTVGECPSDMVVGEAGIWLSLPRASAIVEIDPETGEVISNFSAGAADLEIGSLYTAGSGAVHQFGEVHAIGSVYSWEIETNRWESDGMDFWGLATCPNERRKIYGLGAPSLGSAEPTGLYEFDAQVVHLTDLGGEYEGMYCDEAGILHPWSLSNSHIAGIDRNGERLDTIDVPGMGEVTSGEYGVWVPWMKDLPGVTRFRGGEETDFDLLCTTDDGGPLVAQRTIGGSEIDIETLAAQRAAMDLTKFPLSDPAEPRVATSAACTESGFRLLNGGRLLVGVTSTWSDGSDPVAGLEVQALLNWSVKTHPVGRASTNEMGVVEFPNEVDLIDAGLPANLSGAVLVQTPIIDGVPQWNGRCQDPLG